MKRILIRSRITKKINIIDVNHKFKNIFEKNLAIQIPTSKILLKFRLNY